jgi:hypothetical protein
VKPDGTTILMIIGRVPFGFTGVEAELIAPVLAL